MSRYGQEFKDKAVARLLPPESASIKDVAQARYERGVSTYLDVTDVQRSALGADRAAAQIRTQRLLATVAVARALGGGWEQGEALATVR